MLPFSALQRKRKEWFRNFPFRLRRNFQVLACFGRIHDLKSEKHQTENPPCKLISKAGFGLYKELFYTNFILNTKIQKELIIHQNNRQ